MIQIRIQIQIQDCLAHGVQDWAWQGCNHVFQWLPQGLVLAAFQWLPQGLVLAALCSPSLLHAGLPLLDCCHTPTSMPPVLCCCLCSVQRAACSMQHAACSMQRAAVATQSLWFAAHLLRHACSAFSKTIDMTTKKARKAEMMSGEVSKMLNPLPMAADDDAPDDAPEEGVDAGAGGVGAPADSSCRGS